jgi:biotin synthase
MSLSLIRACADKVSTGGAVTAAEAERLIAVDGPEVMDLLAAANRLRHQFVGDEIRLCSIVNTKSGGCSEDCAFCSQASRFATGVANYGLLSSEEVQRAADEARANGARAFGLVAAWRGLKEGPVLDAVCQSIAHIAARGDLKADASLGLIDSAEVARRLKEAGLSCYNHNLETAPSFFPEICKTHSQQARFDTLRYCREAGISVCCGGILGMGESPAQRVELAFALRQVAPDMVPLNFLDPQPGTPLEGRPMLPPMEILKAIAVFRFILPDRNLMVAGGRERGLRSLQAMMFVAGANATMTGNYLTTTGSPPAADHAMIDDLGLRCAESAPATLARR